MSTGPDPYDVRDAWLGETPMGRETVRAYRTATGRHGYTYLPGQPKAWLDYIGRHVWRATPADVNAWIMQFTSADGSTSGGAARSRETRLSAVSGFYEFAKGARIVPGNPVDAIARVNLDEIEPGPRLTQRQQTAFLRALDRWTSRTTDRDRLLGLLLLDGWRPGQATSWRLSQLHREQQRTTADQPQKGGGDKKGIVLLPEIVEALDAYLPTRRTAPSDDPSLHTGPGVGTVLTSRSGRPLDSYNTPRELVRKVAATSTVLAPVAATITADMIALSPSPFHEEHDDQDQEQN